MFLAITSNEPPKQFGKNSISLFSKRHIPSNALFINLGGGTSRNSLESVFCAFEAGFKIARANKSGVSAIKKYCADSILKPHSHISLELTFDIPPLMMHTHIVCIPQPFMRWHT